MDFKTVLNALLSNFHKHGIRYGLIGGVALGAWGIHRATIDLDFLVHRDDIQKINKIMETTGYECKYQTDNVSQYVSPVKQLGGIDFLHAFREASVGMLGRTKEFTLFNNETKVKVLQAEDIIGLKLQAAINDPERMPQEFLDIEAVMEKHGKQLNWGLIEEYFALFKQQGKFHELKEQYYNAE